MVLHARLRIVQLGLNNIQQVLLELGNGFAFLGRQQKILINRQWHKIDLLFYHILLKCHVEVYKDKSVALSGAEVFKHRQIVFCES